MRQRVSVYGASAPTIALLPALARHPRLELGVVLDPDARVVRRRLAALEPAAAALLQRHLTDDAAAVTDDPALAFVVDAGADTPLAVRLPGLPPRVRVVPVADALRLLGGGGEGDELELDTELVEEDPWATLCRRTLALLDARDPAALVRTAAETACELAQAGPALLRLRDPATGRFEARGRAPARAGGAGLGAPEPFRQLEREAARAALRAGSAVLVPGPGGGGALATPLGDGGRAVGTLTVAGPDAAALEGVREPLAMLAALAARALARLAPAAAPAAAPARLPVDPIRAALEAALAASPPRPCVVLSCRVARDPDGSAADPAPERAARPGTRPDGLGLARRLAARALRARLGPDDVLDRPDPGVLLAVLHDPAPSATEHVTGVVRAVAEHVADRTKGEGPDRLTLHFGYALHPEDGRDADLLLARARAPRIRVL